MSDRKQALVVGGAGFIGSNLCRTLVRQGYVVDCVDNLITGCIEAIQPLRANPRFRFLKLDITESAFSSAALARRYDEIYHLACPTGVPNIAILGEEMIQTCSVGTDNVLRVASAHDARVVFASSAEVYGDPQQFPQNEGYCGNVDPVGPRSAYEEGKRFGESLTRLYASKYNVDAKIVRIFNTFGVGMRLSDSRVIPSFLRCLQAGRALTIYGDGQQTRTHLYVDDLLDGIRLVCEAGASGEVYNIGGREPLTILELIEILRATTPLPIETVHLPHFIEDHNGRQPKTDKVTELGWRQRVSIQEGLRRMLASFDLPVIEPVEGVTGERTTWDLPLAHFSTDG